LIFFNVLDCEYPNACLAKHIPLLRNTIRVARMIDKASQVAFVCWVNYFILAYFHHICASGATILVRSLATFLRVYVKDLTNVLHYEAVFGYFLSSAQSPAFSLCWEGINTFILVFLESPILT